MIDWYDRNQCHHGNVEGHDRSNGRVFKVSYGNPKHEASISSGSTIVQLVELQLHQQRLARAPCAARDSRARAERRRLRESTLIEMAFTHADATRRLRALWALARGRNAGRRLVARGLANDDGHRASLDRAAGLRKRAAIGDRLWQSFTSWPQRTIRRPSCGCTWPRPLAACRSRLAGILSQPLVRMPRTRAITTCHSCFGTPPSRWRSRLRGARWPWRSMGASLWWPHSWPAACFAGHARGAGHGDR